MQDDSPATLRNRQPIAAILVDELPKRGLVLEVASGGGEHAVYFAEKFPALEWQPTDAGHHALPAIQSRMAEASLPNLRDPVALDASFGQWPIRTADAVLCINMAHIAPWAAVSGLFEGAAKLLAKDAPVILYGPYLENDVETAPSNLSFDESLKSRDPRWGLRQREEIDRLAKRLGFELVRREPMPANNLMLVYRKS